MCLRNMTSFIPLRYWKSCGTSHYTTTSSVDLLNLVKVENLWTSIIGVVFTLSEVVKYNSNTTASLASELKHSRLLLG